MQRFEQNLIEHCAPTLAGIKPANLFRMAAANGSSLRRMAEDWDGRLRPLGIRVTILKECSRTHACLVYIYRAAELDAILHDEENLQFLMHCGYRAQDTAGILAQLSERLCPEQDFPHEIGVFLGYPLEDVVGFIENHGRNYTFRGYWKSYGDPEAAKQCFSRYRTCTCAYKQMYEHGTPVMDLVVAA